MGRPRKPQTPGRIEHFTRPFDPAVDVADLAGDRFKNLREGDWGIRYYRPGPLPAGTRGVLVMARISDEIGTTGQRAPFANQVEDIASAAERRGRRVVLAVYWDCETGGDWKRSATGSRRVQRQGFLACCRDALARATQPGAPPDIWTWDTKRLTRGFGVLPLLEELEAAGVKLFTRSGRVNQDMLPIEIMFAKREKDDIAARTSRGRRAMAERIGVPPTKRIPVGWLPQPTADGKRYRVVHDPNAMPAFQRALTGMRFHGWGWADSAAHLNDSGVRRLADRDGTAEAGTFPRPWTSNFLRQTVQRHSWWYGEGSWNVPTFVHDDDGDSIPSGSERIVFRVPAAVLDDPLHGPRACTRPDIEQIAVLASRAVGGQNAPRTADHRRPLVGILRCGACGMAMQTQRVRSRSGADYWLYRCPPPNKMREMGRAACTRTPHAVREERLLADIWHKLTAALGDPALMTARYRAELAALEERVGATQHEWRLAEIRRLTTAEAKLLLQQALADADAQPALDQAITMLRTQRADHQRLVDDSSSAYAELEHARTRLVDAQTLAAQIDTDGLASVLAKLDGPERAPHRTAFIQTAVETVYVCDGYVTQRHVKKLDQPSTDPDYLRMEVHFLGLPLDDLLPTPDTQDLVTADSGSAIRIQAHQIRSSPVLVL